MPSQGATPQHCLWLTHSDQMEKFHPLLAMEEQSIPPLYASRIGQGSDRNMQSQQLALCPGCQSAHSSQGWKMKMTRGSWVGS